MPDGDSSNNKDPVIAEYQVFGEVLVAPACDTRNYEELSAIERDLNAAQEILDSRLYRLNSNLEVRSLPVKQLVSKESICRFFLDLERGLLDEETENVVLESDCPNEVGENIVKWFKFFGSGRVKDFEHRDA